MLEGEGGEAAALAMRIVVALARMQRAPRLIDVTSAHVGSCLYHGRAGLDFAERLRGGGARVAVPTTLNVSSLDLLHPALFRGGAHTAAEARRLMDCYVEMGCRPTWTCAPYQLPARPGIGEHVAWAESNAIVFANSVLGARTERYGDFVDICAAITGRVPDAGLHRDENRAGRILFRLAGVPPRILDEDVLYPVLGHLIGLEAGTRVPVVVGLEREVGEDRVKALGAAAASSGAVALIHVVGSTPEAPTPADALRGRAPDAVVEVTPERLRAAHAALTNTARRSLGAVSLGTPHYSVTEFETLVGLVSGARRADGIEFYVSTGRDVFAAVRERGWIEILEGFGAQIVVDTCTYITPIMHNTSGVVMTDSAKWAWYAPANLGVEVVFASTEHCVRSAIEGRVSHDYALWG